MVLTSVTMLEVIYLLEQVDIGAGIWYASINLVNVFSSILFRKEDQKTFRSIWDRQKYTFLGFFQGYYISLNLCHNIVWRDLNIPQNIALIHYMKEIMLIRLDEQKVACTLVTLVIYDHPPHVR